MENRPTPTSQEAAASEQRRRDRQQEVWQVTSLAQQLAVTQNRQKIEEADLEAAWNNLSVARLWVSEQRLSAAMMGLRDRLRKRALSSASDTPELLLDALQIIAPACAVRLGADPAIIEDYDVDAEDRDYLDRFGNLTPVEVAKVMFPGWRKIPPLPKKQMAAIDLAKHLIGNRHHERALALLAKEEVDPSSITEDLFDSWLLARDLACHVPRLKEDHLSLERAVEKITLFAASEKKSPEVN